MRRRLDYTTTCRMCGQVVKQGWCRVVLVEEKRPRCRVFNGWVCSFCLMMLFAWSDTGDIEMQIGTAVLLTAPPNNLISPTLVGTGGGGGSGHSTKRESKTTHRTRTREEVTP